MASNPRITVVIATYNWSAALRCAIRSVLLQTVQDFEILVVGDGCSDDSEAVVASFNDPRLRWHNLERNHRSQWKANDHGNRHAAGSWIAYLGHDDLWYPTHLQALLHAADRDSADVVTSTMILYWPEAANGHSVAGLYPGGGFADRDFCPPSALAHSRAAYGGAVVWHDPDTLVLPTDVSFLQDLAAAGCAFAQTRELTCFKFNAAWRRDSYKRKRVEEQERLLQWIESGVDFRHLELVKVLQSVVSGRFFPIAAPITEGIEKGEFARRNLRMKGIERRFEQPLLKRIEEPTSFDLASQTEPFEWHELERSGEGTHRWTGPSTRATIDLPVIFDRDLVARINVIGILRPELKENIQLSVHDVIVPISIEAGNGGSLVLVAQLNRQHIGEADGDFGISIDTGRVTRPMDVGLGDDPRWLGIAISSVELSPLTPHPRVEER